MCRKRCSQAVFMQIHSDRLAGDTTTSAWLPGGSHGISCQAARINCMKNSWLQRFLHNTRLRQYGLSVRCEGRPIYNSGGSELEGYWAYPGCPHANIFEFCAFFVMGRAWKRARALHARVLSQGDPMPKNAQNSNKLAWGHPGYAQ